MPDVPQFSRTALLEEDLVFVTLPVATPAESIPFAEVIEEVLVLPEEGDSVRKVVAQTAHAMGAQPNVAYEVRSLPTMKSLISRGVGSGVLPYASVLAEVREGRLLARRIIAPALRRTLCLSVPTGQPSLRNEVALRALIRESLDGFVATLGPLAHPVSAV